MVLYGGKDGIDGDAWIDLDQPLGDDTSIEECISSPSFHIMAVKFVRQRISMI